VPAHCVAVAESGMSSVADVRAAAASGADAVLIGSAFSTMDDPEPLIRDIVQVPRRGR
ncbi:MAG: indole-3-glycerol-phosphate synthase TrpC, partial [Gemmatimonadales bacterium]|nr:indole-3-glycerol-phosphate synthase TrpC [Gemmatimonadales bacterium]